MSQPAMLGILIGTTDGLLELIPGMSPERGFKSPGAIEVIDHRAGQALAAGPEAGAWLHDGTRWRQVYDAAAGADGVEGAPRSARIAPDGSLYLGLEPAAMLHSGDGGKTWANLEGVQNVVKHARQLSTPANASAPYVSGIAFGEDGVFVGIAGAGVWFTRDAGKSWLRKSDGLDPLIHRMWEHPEREDRVYASTASGLYRSEDGGYTWSHSVNGLDRTRAGDAAILPGPPDVLIVAASKGSNGSEGALYRSVNAGLTWSRLGLGERHEFARRPLVTRVWDSADTLFALADGTAWGSHDAGETWIALASGLPEDATALAAAL